MRLYFSERLNLSQGQEFIIPVNDAEVGDVTTSELWINEISGPAGCYSIEIETRDGDMSPLPKGVDMSTFAIADTSDEKRMLYIISDASAIVITAEEDCEIDIKVVY